MAEQMMLQQRSQFRRRRISGIAGAIVPLFFYVAAQAQATSVTVHLDPATSEIHWTLNGNAHATHGTFKLKGGLLTYDPATGVASGEMLVDLSTGESGEPERDAKMKDVVLEVNKYPQAFFKPTKISGDVKGGGTQIITAEGNFNIHGADHPLTLKIDVKLEGNQATATTHFTVPYVAWGMKDPSKLVLRVAKEVQVDITAHGTVDAPAK